MENLHKVSVHHQSKWWVRASSEQSLRDFHDCSLSTKVHFRGWLGNAVSLWSRSFSHLVLPRWNCYSLRDGSKQGGAEFFFIVRFPFKLSAVLISKYHTAISPVVCRKNTECYAKTISDALHYSSVNGVSEKFRLYSSHFIRSTATNRKKKKHNLFWKMHWGKHLYMDIIILLPYTRHSWVLKTRHPRESSHHIVTI